MHWEMRDIVILISAAAGAIAQFIDGVLGMGYGVSASTLLVAFGVAPAVVSATVHAAKLPVAGVSTIAHAREGNVDRAIVVPLAIGGMLGGVLGGLLLSELAGADIRPFVAAVLLALGARMLICSLVQRGDRRLTRELSWSRLALVGIVGGSLDAFGGGGWGPTCTTALMSSDTREPRRLIGSVNAAEVATALAIVVTLAFRLGGEPFHWATVLPLVAGGVLTAPLAARVCSRVKPRVLAGGVGLALVALNASIIAESLGVDALRPALWSLSAVAALAVAGYAVWQNVPRGAEAR